MEDDDAGRNRRNGSRRRGPHRRRARAPTGARAAVDGFPGGALLPWPRSTRGIRSLVAAADFEPILTNLAAAVSTVCKQKRKNAKRHGRTANEATPAAPHVARNRSPVLFAVQPVLVLVVTASRARAPKQNKV
uniref:Uncharacterized protein n=1 Tax=Leersia perrieri TaxID=77586 RepID=A0A0D9VNA3_9ORYZ